MKKNKKLPLAEQLNEKLLRSGRLHLNKAFSRASVSPLVTAIVGFNLLPKSERPDRITLVINSEGGEIFSLIELLDTMENSAIPIDTVVSGMACSCGILLAMAGDKRYATKYSQLMSHQYSAGSGGKEHELYSRVASFEMTSKFMEEHYRKHTGLTKAKIRKHLLPPSDVWLSAQEAKDWNIIDEVI